MQTSFGFGKRQQPNPAGSKWIDQKPVWDQVHGIAIAEVIEPNQKIGEVDGMWTRVPGLWVGVVTADCVPILLEGRSEASTVAVAALHAGWKGCLNNIVDAFFTALPADLNLNWIARIGPSIRACCYQVGPDLIQSFQTTYPNIALNEIEPQARMLDMVAVIRRQLESHPISEVIVEPYCTFCSKTPDFFSFRRGDRSSRQYSTIRLV